MTRALWMTIFTILGLLALSALIWVAGPFLGAGETWPLEGVLTRAILIGVLWAVAGGVWLLRRQRRARAAAALAGGIAEATPDDTDILRGKMTDALATLRTTSGRGGTAWLYDLPWYLMIGPPGSGKTTALVNSGLQFPLAGPGGAEAIAGVGGTRHCDWWFTEDAVLIDTAGRYTTQDSDTDADSRSWTGFLGLLAENRPRQPINGVLVCISIEDLMRLDKAALDAHATAIGRRLDELHSTLKVSFPVYVVLTKMDLVAGFNEFFADLAPEQRAAVWGLTFRPKSRTETTVIGFSEEFDELMFALAEQTTDRLAMEPDQRARSRIFGFPSQMASLKDMIGGFLTRVFEPSRYRSEAALRGVYFTSGTQEGTPIDRIIGAHGRHFGARGAVEAAFSGQGRSYFLTDLMQQVVFREAGWVSTNIAHMRRNLALRSTGYAALVLGALGLGGAWFWSYSQNTQLLRDSDRAMDEYRELAAPILNQAEVADGDLHTVLEPLDKLRFMPAGYARRDEDRPLSEGLGLTQYPRVQGAAVRTYRDALDRLFLPRLIYRLETLLEPNITDAAFVYEGLKVYLMLGGQARMEPDLVRTWMARDWQGLYPGAGNARGRARLLSHLEVILERPSSTVALNGPLVREAQRTLARMPVADRAYTLMKSRAAAEGYPAWTASERGGPDAALVFQTRDGAPLDQVTVPGFFTYDGFHDGVLSQMERMVDRAGSERWVLGDAGAQAAIEAQFGTIRQDIMALYRTEFIGAWDQQIARLKIAPIGSGDLQVMSALAAPTSPLKQLLQSLTRETRLTAERAGSEGGGDAAEAAGGLLTQQAGKAGAAGQLAAEGALQKLGQGGDAPAINYGAGIEAHFKALHEFAGTAADTAAPVDGLVARFNGLYRALSQMQAGGAAREQAILSMEGELQALKADASRMPGVVANMTEGTAAELAGISTGSAKAQLNQTLGNQVTRDCQLVIANRYPFFRKAAREVPLADFARLFGPNGVMQTFFQQKLANMVDQSGRNWRWRGDTALSRTMSLDTLRQFQRAARIRDAFFATGGGLPSVNFTLRPVTLSAEAFTVSVDVDGQRLVYDHGPARPMQMVWPGQGGGRVEIAVTPEIAGGRSRIVQQGVWGLHRLLAGGAALSKGDTMSVSFNVGGREASFELQAASVFNPFSMPELRQFRCPRAL